RTFGHALEDANGASGKGELPVPGTFLINPKGTIRLAHVDVDYTRRLDPDDVIAALKKVNGVEAGRMNDETGK
ncbi:MAG: alkyl hydroperoxide reductase, partial [Verrucomicrobia bacterium]